MDEIKENKDFNFTMIAILVVLSFAIIGLIVYYFVFNRGNGELESKQNNLNSNHSKAADQVIPEGAKNPQDFLDKVQEKAKENQRNYENSLTDFAEKKWRKIFLAVNKVGADYLMENFKLLDKKVEKDELGNTIFRIKYRLANGGENLDNEDYFYLFITKDQVEKFNLANVKPGSFLTEENIKENLDKEGFAKITRIQK